MVKQIGRVPLRCRHGQYLRCPESDSSKPKCFHTTDFALPFFPNKGGISANFYRLLLHVFSKDTLALRTGVAESKNLQVGAGGGAELSAQEEMEGIPAFTTQDTAYSKMIVLL